MPRANRHYIPGCVWPITHRCHKKEFLLKFARDRRRWLQWLFEAKKRKGAYWEDRYHATAIETDEHFRDGKWTESIAVGSEKSVTATKEKLGFKAKGREVIGGDGSYELRESPAAYEGILGHENEGLRLENASFWDDNFGISTE